jgi:hypothetical protein
LWSASSSSSAAAAVAAAAAAASDKPLAVSPTHPFSVALACLRTFDADPSRDECQAAVLYARAASLGHGHAAHRLAVMCVGTPVQPSFFLISGHTQTRVHVKQDTHRMNQQPCCDLVCTDL